MASTKKILCDATINCYLCHKSLLLRNIKRHFTCRHTDFLNIRKSVECVSFEQALLSTYSEIKGKGEINQYVLNIFQKRISTFYSPEDKELLVIQGTLNSPSPCRNTMSSQVAKSPEHVTKTRETSPDRNEVMSQSHNKEHSYNRQLSRNCECCSSLEDIFNVQIETLSACIKMIINKECSCIQKSLCCCSEYLSKLNSLTISSQYSEIQEEKSRVHSTIYENFSSFIKENKKYYHCKICYKFSRTESKWTTTGVSKSCKGLLHDIMRKHLSSKQHVMSVQYDQLKSYSTVTERAECIENLCIVAQFLASHKCSSHFYKDFCLLIDDICRNISPNENIINPIGNRYQCRNGIIKVQKVCYDASVEKVKSEFNDIFVVTSLQKRVMLAVDKGTALKDATRQVIVATIVDDEGMPKEIILSASAIMDQTARGAKDHLYNEVKSIINTKNISCISTDSAPVYVDTETGMFSQLVNDMRNFSKNIIFIPDFCDKMDRLLLSCKHSWISDSIAITTKIVSDINFHPRLAKILKEHAAVSGQNFFAMESIAPTRYIKYLRSYLTSLIYNIQILTEALQNIIELDDFDDTPYFIVKNIIDAPYIAKIILLHNFFCELSFLETEAHSKSFGPFQYIDLLSKFKKLLKNAKTIPEHVASLILEGKLCHEFKFRRRTICVNIDFKELNEKYSNARNTITPQDSLDSIRMQFLSWIDSISSNIDILIQIPVSIRLTKKIFYSLSLDDKINSFRKLMISVNTTFKRCGYGCEGILDCTCLDLEFQRFWHTFLAVDEAELRSPDNLRKAISYYLSKRNWNLVKTQNIPNVLRVLEVIQIMKGSQSSTEGVMSVVGKLVEDNYEKSNKFGVNTETKLDRVAINVFLSYNSNISTVDSKLAREKFINSCHFDALIYKSSQTVKRKRKLKRFKSKKRKTLPEPAILTDSSSQEEIGSSTISTFEKPIDGILEPTTSEIKIEEWTI